MKFGTLLELNSNIEWFDKYVDYDGLKKLFPNEPFDPSYQSCPTESSKDDGDYEMILGSGFGGIAVVVVSSLRRFRPELQGCKCLEQTLHLPSVRRSSTTGALFGKPGNVSRKHTQIGDGQLLSDGLSSENAAAILSLDHGQCEI
jgi:hypothetical protein